MTAKQTALAAAMGVQLPFDEYPNLPPPELFPKRPAWEVLVRLFSPLASFIPHGAAAN